MIKSLLFSTAMLLGVDGTAAAAPVLLEGNFIRVTIGDDGTLGNGYGPEPGLVYDATGSRNFTGDDFLKPGFPWEFFTVKANEVGVTGNNNDTDFWMRDFRFNLIEDLSGQQGFDRHVRWLGASESMQLSNDFFFNDDDQSIQVRTTITALLDLSGLRFARSIDPDQDADTYGEYETRNGRGYDANGDGDFDDAGDVAPGDWVHAQGARSGLSLGLYSDSPYAHDTGVSYDWLLDPDFFLAGIDEGDGDNALGMGFDLGDLARGQSVSFMYAYVLSASLGGAQFPVLGEGRADRVAVSDLSISSVPEPGTLVLMSLGVAGLGLFTRRGARNQT